MVIDGATLAAIAAYLDEQGIKPRSTRKNGTGWWEGTIGEMVRNPAYKGRRCQQDPKTKRYGKLLHRCESLVDAGVWKKANDNLDARPKRGKVFAANRAMLSGALFCPVCDGSPMYRINTGKGTTHIYYRCSGRGPQRKGCGLMVDAELVDTAVNKLWTKHEKKRPPISGAEDGEPFFFSGSTMLEHVEKGNDHKAELEAIEDELADLPLRRLPDDEEDAERNKLRAERKRVAALPVAPDKVVWTPTGKSYTEIWTSLPAYERGPWLTSERFLLTASHEQVIVYRTKKDGSRWPVAAGPIRVRTAPRRLKSRNKPWVTNDVGDTQPHRWRRSHPTGHRLRGRAYPPRTALAARPMSA